MLASGALSTASKLFRLPTLNFAAQGLAAAALCASVSFASAARAEDPKAAATGSAAKAAAAAPEAKVPPSKEPSKDAKKTEAKKAPAAAAAAPASVASSGVVIEIKTSEGTIKLLLDEKAAPESVKNFLMYVNDKFYDGTIFHRVINKFMVQGGGFTVDAAGKMTEKATKSPITNEAKNGLKNDRGTIAMARTGDPNSATSQFFINHVNNERLNFPQPDGHGYAVFGKVTDGMDVVDKIASVKTGIKDGMGDVPDAPVKIISVAAVKPAG